MRRWKRSLVWMMFFLFQPLGNNLCILWPKIMPGTPGILTTAVQAPIRCWGNSEKCKFIPVTSYSNAILSQGCHPESPVSGTFLMMNGCWEFILSLPLRYQSPAMYVAGFLWDWLTPPLLVALSYPMPAPLIGTVGILGGSLCCHSQAGNGCPSQE